MKINIFLSFKTSYHCSVFFYQLLVLVIVKCEYISHSPYIAKEQKF